MKYATCRAARPVSECNRAQPMKAGTTVHFHMSNAGLGTDQMAVAPLATRTIQPHHGWRAVDLRAIWSSRELLYFLVWRDVKVRYKQTAMGAAWSVLKPLLAVAVFVVVFGQFLRLPSEGVPYAPFVLAGVLPWTYFSSAFYQITNSITESEDLISKVAFPRMLLPLSKALAGVIELGTGTGLLVLATILFRLPVRPTILLAPVFLMLAAITVVSVGIWSAALNVRFRDVGNTVPFLLQVWMYATPIVYPASAVRGKAQWILALNPMTGVIEGLRWALFGTSGVNIWLFSLSMSVVVLLLGTGAVYFARTERLMADIV